MSDNLGEIEKVILNLQDEYLAGVVSGRSKVELECILDMIADQRLRLLAAKIMAEQTIGEELEA